MKVGVSVEGESAEAGLHDLRRILTTDPQLRGRIRSDGAAAPPPGAMGLPGEALLALLEPGGVATAFVAGLITWLAARRTECSVTVTRPDGTQISITSTRSRNLGPQQRAEFIRDITAALTDGDGQAQE